MDSTGVHPRAEMEDVAEKIFMENYYLTNRSKTIYLAISILSLSIVVGLFLHVFRSIICFQLYFGGLGISGIYFIFQKMKNEHITISNKGIEYHSPWIVVETKWESIEKISYYWHDGFRYECLLVDNSQTRIKKWSFPDRYPPTPLDGFPNKTIFPLSCYDDDWRDSELGQQIKQYVPHLFV